MSKIEIIRKYKKARNITDKYLLDSDEHHLVDEILALQEQVKKLTISVFVNCVYVVTERDNYGEQLFKGVFANREKAIEYLAGDGLKESNIDEINEIELD